MIILKKIFKNLENRKIKIGLKVATVILPAAGFLIWQGLTSPRYQRKCQTSIIQIHLILNNLSSKSKHSQFPIPNIEIALQFGLKANEKAAMSF